MTRADPQPPRRRLGARLAAWTAAITVGALVVFGLTAAIAVWNHEEAEGDEADAVDEALEQVGPTLAITAPLVLVLAYATTRRLSRRLTDRIDEVVVTARRMTHEDLGARLPVSPAGDELDELTAALNGLFARLDQGLAAQRQFVADASHELRTPLTVLRTDLEIARRRPRTPDEWEAVAGRAHDEVVRMTAMVEALLRLARTAEPPRAEPIAGRALVDDVAAR
ncbi:MAG TPA: histidine kinase dimerization/phospho-acceptor domain-containing protein, partial [Kofleriaceae bacterium]|nr:histidine kinase dimerization/phospho-acceptor domain-containing protein [Kofleriaceae bacterium]